MAFYDHAGKGERFAKALRDAGHTPVPDAGDVALVDHDHRQALCDAHEAVVLYPHGGAPVLTWDGQAVHPHVRLNLVPGLGHAQVMAVYGFGVPCVPVGWPFCDLAEPRYPEHVRRVLFAPVHPLGDGYLSPQDAEVNRRALDVLVTSGLDVSVSAWGRPEGFGLDPRAPVRWVRGGTLDTAEVDAADLVVANSTMLGLAVARGVPALSFAADKPPDLSMAPPTRHPASWASYADLLRYPYDLADGPLEDLVGAVCRPDPVVQRWRRRFVGGPFEPEVVVRLVEALKCHQPKAKA